MMLSPSMVSGCRGEMMAPKFVIGFKNVCSWHCCILERIASVVVREKMNGKP
jgi:hypothetical protein